MISNEEFVGRRRMTRRSCRRPQASRPEVSYKEFRHQHRSLSFVCHGQVPFQHQPSVTGMSELAKKARESILARHGDPHTTSGRNAQAALVAAESLLREGPSANLGHTRRESRDAEAKFQRAPRTPKISPLIHTLWPKHGEPVCRPSVRFAASQLPGRSFAAAGLRCG